MRIKMLIMGVALLALAGCGPLNTGPRDNRPPNGGGPAAGGPPGAQEVTYTVTLLAYAGGPATNDTVSAVVTDITADGKVAEMVDPVTGTHIQGPDYMPSIATPLIYRDLLLPGVVNTAMTVTTYDVEIGGVLHCDLVDSRLELLDTMTVTQVDVSGGTPISVTCTSGITPRAG